MSDFDQKLDKTLERTAKLSCLGAMLLIVLLAGLLIIAAIFGSAA